MENIKIYVENGLVHIVTTGTTDISGLNTGLSRPPAVALYDTNGELTASVVNTDKIKVVTSSGIVLMNNVPHAKLKAKDGTTALGANATAVRNALNGSTLFGSSTLETKISDETTKITALENAVKTATGDRGVFITNAKDETASKVKLTNTTAKLQAGGKTGLDVEEDGLGTLTFKVAAGSSGSEVETTALTIDSTDTGRTAHRFTGDTFTLKANAATTGGRLSLLEGSNNGTNALTLAAPNSLTAATTLTFPDGAGSNGQVLSTNGSGTLSWVDQPAAFSGVHAGAADILRFQSNQLGVSTNLTSTIGADRLLFYDHSAAKLTALELGTNLSISGTTLNATDTDTNTNLGNTNLSVSSGTRSLSLSNTNTSFRIMTGQGVPFQVTNTSGNGGKVSINGDFRVDSGSLSGGIIKLEENPQGGSNFVALQAPSSISSDLTFTLPSTDGSSGQFLQTDGSGNLSFASGGSGGGGPILLGQYGGRFTWSSADEGERVAMSNFYGFSYFSHTTELSQNAMRTYSASQAVDSATSTVDNKKLGLISFPVLTTNKKVKCCYSFYLQSHNTGSTWGVSLWGGTLDTSGNLDSERTVTLRAKTADITATTNSNARLYHGEFTTTSNINGGRIMPMVENRTGNWSGTVYMYGVFQLYYVD